MTIQQWEQPMPDLPQQGEIWRVRLDPGVGDEISKTRPCVVVSSSNVGRLGFTEKLGSVASDALLEIEATIHLAVEVL